MAKQQGGALDIAGGVLWAKFALWFAAKLGRVGKRLVFRWRRVLSPVIFATLLWAVAAIWNLTFPAWCWLALVIPAGGGTVAWFGPVLSERWSLIVTKLVPTGLDRGTAGVLDRKIERLYFAGLSSTIGGYLFIRSGWGSSDLTLWWWRVGLVLFGGAWWYHRRVRTAGRGDRIARRWGRINEGRTNSRLAPLIGSKPVEVHGRGPVTVLKIKLAEALTLADMSRLVEPLASYYGMRPRAIKPREDHHNARYVWLTFLPTDPWKHELPHPAPSVGSISIAKTKGKILVGIKADGEEQSWIVQHAGLYGKTRSGKSGLIHSLLMWISAYTDAIAVGIDMAGGATLGAWQPMFARPIATNLDEAIVLLERVLAFIQVRERAIGADDFEDDIFEPSDEFPWLFLVIDEFPNLFTAAKAAGQMGDGPNAKSYFKYVVGLLDQIAKQAAKTGTILIEGAQNPTKDDNGSKEFQAQLRSTFGLGLDELQSRNLWGIGERLGWTSTDLAKGQYRLRDDDHTVPEVAKGYWVPKHQRKKQAAAAAKLRKCAEPTAWAALMGVDAPVIDAISISSAPADRVLQALLDGPMKVDPELVEATGLSRAQVYRKLKGHGEAEFVVRLDDARFQLTDAGRGFLRGENPVSSTRVS
jgi:hypothetical protein